MRPISSSDVNDHLRSVAEAPVTAKAFRTWMGTLIATTKLVTLPAPASETAANEALVKAFDAVAAEFRNTRAVSRASYVHPPVVDWYREGVLSDQWESTRARESARLLPERAQAAGTAAPTRVRTSAPLVGRSAVPSGLTSAGAARYGRGWSPGVAGAEVRMSNGSSDEFRSVAIHQATGMVAAQAGCGIDEAFHRLNIRAAAIGQSLHDTALDVLDRRIRFYR